MLNKIDLMILIKLKNGGSVKLLENNRSKNKNN